MKKYLICFLAIALILSCETNEKPKKIEDTHEKHTEINEDEIQKEEEPLQLKEAAHEVLKALYSYSFSELSPFQSAKKDIVFSPYLTFSKENAACFSPKALEENDKKEAVLYWGIQDGTGDPINKTVKAYFERYVNRGNYLSDDVEILENEIKVQGNSINSIPVVFPEAEFVSYYLPHDKDDAAEMSWKTLVIVFERVNNELKLKAVVNHEWTI